MKAYIEKPFGIWDRNLFQDFANLTSVPQNMLGTKSGYQICWVTINKEKLLELLKKKLKVKKLKNN